MRIAFVYDAVYPYILGGVEKRVWELACRLVKRGHEVHIYGMHLWNGERTLVKEGVTLHGVCEPQMLYQKGKRKITQAIAFGSAVFFPLAREHFDVVDCQQFPYFSALSSLISCRISRSPLVITWHEVWGDYWYEYLGLSGSAGKFLERIIALFSVKNIAVSEATSDSLKKAVRNANEVKVIPNGIDLSRIDSISPSESISDLIFVGRLIREKHADLLLESVRHLIATYPSLCCTIIGDGPERTNLEMRTGNLGIGDHVQFVGFLDNSDEVIARMKAAKVFVLPSTREGFGISAIEALACGIPIVTIDHPQNASRFFVGSGCGALSRLDPIDLADKIHEMLIHSGEKRDACIMSARKYDWETITDSIEEYYQSISGK
jgi:glycosyltransferase involved in cell wall biosynthesis